MTQAPMIAAPTSLEVVWQLYDAVVRGDATAIMALLDPGQVRPASYAPIVVLRSMR